MDEVRAQYEAYPYPERAPEDEARRLITGSPSDLAEIDHFLFRGRRDWRQPFRALVAGGGTGDGLIQLAQRLADVGTPAEIVWLDLSSAARRVAEARAAARGLGMVRFVTGDLGMAPDLGPFDYIDCCGVLHHLDDPGRGFRALADALAPGGGIGLMVYAPYGRSGVYPLQEAFRALLGGDDPATRVRLGREAVDALPETNWFRRNPFLSDHRVSDAGFHDLLLNVRDRPFDVPALLAALAQAGLGLVSFTEPLRYDPALYLPDTPEFRDRVARLDMPSRMALAERLAGDIRKHVAYVAPALGAPTAAARQGPDSVPRLNALAPRALADTVARRGAVTVEWSGVKRALPVPRSGARLIARIGGGSLGAIARAERLDWIAFAQEWAPVHRVLTGINRLHYTGLPPW